MFNNRMLAVAAVLVMAVPALGAATPIVVPPVPEQLVEGHTVFTVIEIVKATQTNEVRFAAAVAVLVREYQAARTAQRFPGVLWFNDQYLVNPLQNANDYAAFRYPCGGAVMAVNQGDPDPRIVLAYVEATDMNLQADLPDGVDDVTGDVDETFSTGPITYGDSEYTYPAGTNPEWVKPYPGTYYYGQTTGPDGQYNTADDGPRSDYAWIGAEVGPGQVNATNPSAASDGRVWSDTVIGTVGGDLLGNWNLLNATPPWDYRESYLITDPNDHSWVIDKYEFYTRDGFSTVDGPRTDNVDNLITKSPFGPDPDPVPVDTDGDNVDDSFIVPSEHYPEAFGGALETSYAYPVWVVNMLGSPVFVPDHGVAVRIGSEFIGENCTPFKDLIEDPCGDATGINDFLTGAGLPNCPDTTGALCGVALEDVEFVDPGNDTDVTLNAYNGVPPWTDDPCMSYQEPSRNGYCYGGQTSQGACPHGTPGNNGKHYKDGVLNEPLRQYNALLYFKLEDLRVWDGNLKDHCSFDPTIGPDTNGDGIPDGDCNPALSQDTNGCSEEYYPWGPNPPQAAYDWPCGDQHTDGVDSDGDGFDTECGSTNGLPDDCEGNSHPFHPTAPPHVEAEPCLPQFSTADPNGQDGRRRNPSNHGGSSYITPGTRANDPDVSGQSWYQVYAPCDYMHTTRNIDIYFSPGGRPFPPTVRYFDVVDLEGSSAPFQDYHASYPSAP